MPNAGDLRRDAKPDGFSVGMPSGLFFERKDFLMSQSQCCCSSPDLPWSGRGTNLDISGCRFSLYPMDSNFVPIILGALEKTDTSAVWAESDALSTVYRGKRRYVHDAVRALFINAYTPGVHMALEGMFSKGCPGDCDGDSVLNREGEAPNEAAIAGRHFPVKCKLSLYPLGDAQYIDKIAQVWRMAEQAGLEPVTIHYATRISGDVQRIFDYLEDVCRLMEETGHHFTLHFTLSVNSPTQE